MAEPDGMRRGEQPEAGEQDAEPRRADGGLGDDQGTRVGSPDAGQPRESKSTGAGAEAAEGVHSMHGRDETERSGSAENREAQSGDATRAGSEPLQGGRQSEHESGYGGKGGQPRKSGG